MKDPIRSFVRQDGRHAKVISRLQFMPANLESCEKIAQDEILVPGLTIGAVIRCHWAGTSHSNFPRAEEVPFSQRVHFSGIYHGESRSFGYQIPGAFFWGPTPVFEMDAWHHNGTRVPVGSVAVASLTEGKRAILDGVDTRMLYDSFPEMTLVGRRFQSIGSVQIGGLYYVPPLEQA